MVSKKLFPTFFENQYSLKDSITFEYPFLLYNPIRKLIITYRNKILPNKINDIKKSLIK